jgi:acyl carrier protein
MSQTPAKTRLEQCFLAVLPTLDGGIEQASAETVETWDSVAQVTLISLVEEEFGIVVPAEEYEKLTSFRSFLDYVERAG